MARRREAFEPFIDKSGLGLEVGPSFMPTFPKRDGWNVLVLDTGTADELFRDFSQDPSADADGLLGMEAVDLIDRGAGLKATVSGRGPFDYIVACHVVEHVPDLVRFMLDAAEVLQEDGVLLLAVPTRELSFDFFRPLSTPGDVVLAHMAPDAFTARAMTDDVTIRAALEGAVAWLPWQLEVALREGVLPESAQDQAVPDWLQDSGIDKPPRANSWTGHRWVFEPPTFRFIMEFIAATYAMPLTVEMLETGLGSEFLVVMRRSALETRERAGLPPLDRSVRQAYGARQAVLTQDDVALRANDVLHAQLVHHQNLSRRLQERLDDLISRPLVRITARLSRIWRR